jgi:hypothetical protein
MKALLLAFSCLVLLAVACGGEDFNSDNSSSGGSAGAPAGPDAGAIDNSAAATSTQLLLDKLVVTTDIDVEIEELRPAYVAISRLARDFGGFVEDAQINDAQDDASAFLRLRVPSLRHDEVVASIRGLSDAEVKREQSTAREVTAEYTDLQSRLTNLQVTEAQYQTLLQPAGTIEEVLKVTAKLDEVRGEVELVEGRIKLLDDQTGYATIAVSLAPPVTAASSNLPSPLRVLVDSLATSLTVAHAALNLAIVLFVAGLWLIPAAAIAALLWRRFRRQFQTFKAWLG